MWSIRKNKSRLLAKLTLTRVISLVVLGTTSMATLAIGYFALQTLYENKVIDHWAISFLDLEQRNQKMVRALERELQARQRELPSSIFEVQDGRRLVDYLTGAPASFEALSFKDLDRLVQEDRHSVKVIAHEGRHFFVDYRKGVLPESTSKLKLKPGRHVFAWEFEYAQIMTELLGSKFSGDFYVVNSSAQLVYSNKTHLTQANIAARPLVKKFIVSPLSHGQMQINSDDEESRFGVFQEVSGTNLVTFVETDRESVLGSIWSAVAAFGGYVLIILAIGILVAQVPVLIAVSPLKGMIQLAREVAKGNFSARFPPKSYGEIHVLSLAMNQMNSQLMERDRSIREAAVREQEQQTAARNEEIKAHLAGFFSEHPPAPLDVKCSIACLYEPSAAVSGDWYGYHWHPNGSVSFVLLDVAGVELEAGFVTSMVATAYRSFCLMHNELNLKAFVDHVNSLLYQGAKGKATAAMIVGRFDPNTRLLEYVSAGMETPILSSVQPRGLAAKRMRPKNLVGQDPQLEWISDVVTSVQLQPGDVAMFFSDGLRQRARRRLPIISRRGVAKFIATNRNLSLPRTMEHLKSGWKQKIKDTDPKSVDDLCVIMLKAA